MRLFLTTVFVGLGLCVSNAADACTTSVHRLQTDNMDFRLPATCTQFEKQLDITPVACGIHSADELAQIKLAQESG